MAASKELAVVTSIDQATQLATISPQVLVARMQKIEEAMSIAMKVNVDYGTIPGTPKPTLYKSGAERLCTLFNIAPISVAVNIDNPDGITVRVTCTGRHQLTNALLGTGLGEASSNEAKWKWRKPVCQQEFDETAPDRRRKKWCKGKNGSAYQEQQIRTEPDDIGNTVLQMATKRALVAMVRTVTSASAIFLQDLEDMPEDVREQILEAERDRRGDRSPPPQQQQQAKANTTTRAPQSNGAPGVVTEAQVKLLLRKMDDAGMSAETFCGKFGIAAVAELPFDKMNAALEFIKDPEREAIQQQGEPK